MANATRLRLGSSLLAAAAWLAPCGLLAVGDDAAQVQAQSPQNSRRDGPRAAPVVSGAAEDPAGGSVQEPPPRRKARAQAARGGTRQSAAKGKSAQADQPEAAKKKAEDQEDTDRSSPEISFKRDVAPILVAHCVACHSSGRPGLTRGKLDLTTFANLMQGTPREKVVAPNKPEESHLVRRVRGLERPRMPQGNDNNRLADEVIGRIERWIAAGATLDAGLDPKAPLESYAASPDQIRRNLLAKLGPKERDQLIEKAGRDRWKKTNPALTPEIHQGEHFALFSNLPRERAVNALKFLETQHGHLRRLLGPAATNWVEKVSVYVFNSRKDFVEFVRSIENREPDPDLTTAGSLTVPQPFLAVADPLEGKKEEPAAARRKPRGKRGDEKQAEDAARSLAGLLAQGLGESAVAAYGKSPRWLAYGIGEYLAAAAEPRGPHARRLRQVAHSRYQQGWITRATDVLGESDQVSLQDMRGISLAIVECLLAPNLRPAFPLFAKGMSEGKERLDDVLRDVYGMSREEFLNATGDWIAQQYGQGG